VKNSISINDLDLLKTIVKNAAQSINAYVDIRVESGEGIGSYTEDGKPRVTSLDWNFSLGVRVITKTPIEAAGYFGAELGIVDFSNFSKVLKNAINTAYERAKANAKYKYNFQKKSHFGKSIYPTLLSKTPITNTTVNAEFEIDPRIITPKEITDYSLEASSKTKSFHPYIKHAEVIINTGISRQIFASSEGTFIDSSYTSTGGTVFIVGENTTGPIDLYHHTGNQLGFEVLTNGKNAHKKNFIDFSKQIAREVILLCDAKPAPAEEKAVTVVLDPDLVALFAHEIIGHPSELDRALKWEAGYAGRSWLFDDLENNQIGKKVGSDILTAFSDPTLKGGYGHYMYDDEGTPAKRIYHIKNGIYSDFMNSRETANILNASPNGHYKASDASVVPLIRMSASAIAPGKSNPKKIIEEVESGYYAVGHRIPSISESRENFQIAPRLIYEIKNGKLGQVFRNGRITADSKDFFMSIDALGNDFTLFAVPNCGKGKPMQAKQVGNGGPTARGRAKIAKGN